MDVYLIPIKTAVLVFIGLVNLISVPILFREYHKKGALPIFKAIIIYSFIFYMLTAFFMTLLPLPTKEHVASLTTPYAQLVPFQFVRDIFENTRLNLLNPKTYFPTLTQPVVLQVVFNIILTIPFGVYLRYYFKKDLKTVFLLTFLLSLFYETTQITGVYGLYPRPYRLFDVDDLMLNTLGGIVGYTITPALVFMFPTREDIEKKTQIEAQKVPFLRRIFAYLIDYYILATLITLSTQKFTLNPYMIELFIAAALSLIYFLRKGRSVGLSLMRLKIVSADGLRLKITQAFMRSMTFSIAFNLVFKVSMDFFNYLNAGNIENTNAFAFYIILIFVIQGIFVGHVIYTGIIKKSLLFYEKLSLTHIESTI